MRENGGGHGRSLTDFVATVQDKEIRAALSTYTIEGALGTTELPALVEIADDNSFLGIGSLIDGPTTRLVNYRFVEHRFEVDKVLKNARLTAGVGSGETAVTITRTRAD